jgi:alpha-mannosidase
MMNDWEIKGRIPVYYRRVRNFIEDLVHDVLRDQIPFEASYALSAEPVALAQSFDLARKTIKEGEVWGHTWESGYFLLRAKLPSDWEGRSIAAWLDFGGEGLIYSSKGEALASVTSGSAFVENYNKTMYRSIPAAQGGETVELWVEAAANQLFGVKEAPHPVKKSDPDRHGTWEAKLGKLRLCTFDYEVWSLVQDLNFLVDLYDDLDGKSVRAVRILKAMFEVTQAYREDPKNAVACRAILARELSKPASASQLSTTVVGHAHIDSAWLWRLKETHRKVARTYAAQLDLIDRYPGYVFGASAPQHHQWIKDEHPALYERIKKAVAAGRWEPQGGMWIESDCNLISGESMVRQLLHGKNFWKDEFGVEVTNCWIPDVFGYSASMPQILKKAGVDYFLTQKMSWSKLNEFPHDTFHWQGIDGSKVLTHFPPEYTYNSFANPAALRRAEATFHERADLDEFITLVGIGDGGGGPKEEHLENVLRSRDLESVPKASFGTAAALFERLALKGAELETWVGELYLEYHRGTYTTQATTKKNNRRLESEIRAVEALCSCLPLDLYPAKELDSVVKILLLHQFHDIIPGSSIHAVYVDAEAAYAQAFAALEAVKAAASKTLLKAEADAVTLFNCLSEPFQGPVVLPGDSGWVGPDGRRVATQDEEGSIVAMVTVPALGFLKLKRAPRAETKAAAPTEELVLENELVRYRFDRDARLVEAWDKRAGRSVLKAGEAGNVLSFYQDTPHNFEAWDIDFYYPDQFLAKAQGVAVRALGGDVRRGLVFDLSVGHSTLTQKVFLEPDSPALRFDTLVDWRESQRMLRVAFPLESQATEALCDIQYGYTARPTHANTEWDFAKFEVCAHHYVDISEPDYGVALLNDSKYGYSVQKNVLGLTLLRSPLYPDPDADLGRHEFTYVLYPHGGGLVASDVRSRGASLNRKPLLFAGQAPTIDRAPVWLEGEGMSLEVLKKAEKEEALIVRVVETRGARASGMLKTSLSGTTIAETDLMEWKDGETRPFAMEAGFSLFPFEIKTFKIRHVRNQTV